MLMLDLRRDEAMALWSGIKDSAVPNADSIDLKRNQKERK